MSVIYKEKNNDIASDCCSNNQTAEVKDSCCSIEDSSNKKPTEKLLKKEKNIFQFFLPSIISFVLMIAAIIWDNATLHSWFKKDILLAWYIVAYLPVAVPVIKDMIKAIKKKDIFSEFTLMFIATMGAFYIGEYPEAVAVMLFYTVGETLQGMAVRRSKKNIQRLLDQRPDETTILVNNEPQRIKAAIVEVGSIIQLKPGEKLALDGILLNENSSFNTAALTGESVPDTKRKGDMVLAGMINQNNVALVEVKEKYQDSKLSKMLQLVQEATAHKAPTELFIRKFARVYTPMVVLLAALITFIPYFFTDNYIFNEHLYNGLVFLVVSCPCALVISVPLGYFGGIGAASKNGILVKGSNYLDLLAKTNEVVMDKTGTLTEGVFEVNEIKFKNLSDEHKILSIVNAVESHSTHPVASALRNYIGDVSKAIEVEQLEEVPGMGLRAFVDGKEILVGNFKLLDKFGIAYNDNTSAIPFTIVAISYNKEYQGYITISDKIKEDAKNTVEQLKNINVYTTMLSGDRKNVVAYVAQKLNIDKAYGELLPEEKMNKLKEIKTENNTIAFVGDGVNDAPVIALSDVGIAMGGLGSDATIETADVIIQDDKPSKIPKAIKIGKATKHIIWQNIVLALGIKIIVMTLSAFGYASMWAAVFADVGVALLAVLNATRVQYKRF